MQRTNRPSEIQSACCWSLKGARRKENVDLFPHPGDDKSAVTSDDLLLLQ